MKTKAHNLMCIFTDPLGVTDIGGTLAKHAHYGGKVIAVVMWEYPREIKKQIQKAASILGTEIRVLGYKRGEIALDTETKKVLVEIIREEKPDIVITFDHEFAISTTHGDHIVVHNLVMESLGLCYRENFAPEQIKKGLSPHFVKAVYYPLWKPYIMPDVIVDVTDFLEKKIKATLALKEQMKTHGQFLQKIYSKNALEAMIPGYKEVMQNSLEVGRRFNKERRKVTSRFWGANVWLTGTAFGEAFRRRTPLKLDLLLC